MGLPIGNVLNGLMRGAALGQMIRRSAMEREQMERIKARDERGAQMEDLRATDLLTRMGRPVTAGVVEETVKTGVGSLPSSIQIDQPLVRKADASRTVKYKTRDGRTIESELLTPAEQKQRAREDLQGELAMRNESSLDRMRREATLKAEMEQQNGVDPTQFGLPNLGRKVPVTELDSLARASAYRANTESLIKQRGARPEDPIQTVLSPTDDAGNVTPVIVRKSGKVERGAPIQGAGKKARVKSSDGSGEKPATKAQTVQVEARKQAALRAAETKFRRGELDEDQLQQEKQAAEDAYVAELGALGIEARPVQYGRIRKGAAKVTPVPAVAAVQRARNPNTGEIVELRNGQWVKVQ